MRLLKQLMVSVMLLTLALESTAYAVDINQKDPEVMVKELSETVVSEVDKQRAELETDPQKVKVFANEYVLPYVDTPKMARYVMGQYWKQASASQQKAFTEAFTNTLLRSYAKSILKLRVTKIVVSKMVETRPGRASVSTEVTQADGNVSTVVYRAYLNKNDQKWFLYDVSIEGISMLLNYRKSFASEFQKKGIDEVIAGLNAKNNANQDVLDEG
ncbi:MlaC/ttg2D family ABC transporter substrate-binding protein [Thiomicrospira sp. S5]|uniref:MlaC/ttg2D family ABC transporter substrate-binding protein n=1 Tax=Thiomicrospira sp. S5 TaxID=1803865 RepID=UPI000F8A143D|nr:ABC transporter substrate-binding protein [Thiomicrospira sp. S5]AZR82289.1 toluene tolerance protein [Thiomicrospira sp. S5]